jgi:DNA-binding NtrC family response regulator
MYGEPPFAAKPLRISSGASALTVVPQAGQLPKLVLLCELGEHSAQASIELSRSGWAVADSSTLPSTRNGRMNAQQQGDLPCIGLVLIGPDPAATRRVLEELDDVLPARFLWIALLPNEAANNAQDVNGSAKHGEEARALIAEYCFDFFTLPVNWDYLANTLGHALGMLSLADSQGALENLFADRGIIGESEAMRALLHGVRKVAQHDEPLIITGEPGTGKTLAARAVHARSLRGAAPFVAFNCGSYTHAALAEALFGAHGGTNGHSGTVGAAHGGTLLLTNVQDLPPAGQQLLCRMLEEKVFADTDADQAPRNVDVRIICAHTPDTLLAPPHGSLSSELFHRLNVLSLHVPALRERTGDLHLLARYFLNRYSGESNRRLRGFTKDAQAALTHYHWPGNVRELISRVRRAIVMCEGRSITARDLGLQDMAPQEHILTLEQARNQADIAAINSALARHRNRLSHAARDLGISRVTLYRLLERYQIKVRGVKIPPQIQS